MCEKYIWGDRTTYIRTELIQEFIMLIGITNNLNYGNVYYNAVVVVYKIMHYCQEICKYGIHFNKRNIFITLFATQCLRNDILPLLPKNSSILKKEDRWLLGMNSEIVSLNPTLIMKFQSARKLFQELNVMILRGMKLTAVSKLKVIPPPFFPHFFSSIRTYINFISF